MAHWRSDYINALKRRDGEALTAVMKRPGATPHFQLSVPEKRACARAWLEEANKPICERQLAEFIRRLPNSLSAAVASLDTRLARVLFSHAQPGDFALLDEDGRNPLYQAAIIPDARVAAAMVRLILQRISADDNADDCLRKVVNCIDSPQAADVDTGEVVYRTSASLLYRVCFLGHTDVVEQLLAHGAHASVARGDKQFSAIVVLCSNPPSGSGKRLKTSATVIASLEVFKRFGHRFDIVDAAGHSPLHMACEQVAHGNLQAPVILWLLSNGCFGMLQQKNGFGKTPLAYFKSQAQITELEHAMCEQAPTLYRKYMKVFKGRSDLHVSCAQYASGALDVHTLLERMEHEGVALCELLSARDNTGCTPRDSLQRQGKLAELEAAMLAHKPVLYNAYAQQYKGTTYLHVIFERYVRGEVDVQTLFNLLKTGWFDALTLKNARRISPIRYLRNTKRIDAFEAAMRVQEPRLYTEYAMIYKADDARMAWIVERLRHEDRARRGLDAAAPTTTTTTTTAASDPLGAVAPAQAAAAPATDAPGNTIVPSASAPPATPALPEPTTVVGYLRCALENVGYCQDNMRMRTVFIDRVALSVLALDSIDEPLQRQFASDIKVDLLRLYQGESLEFFMSDEALQAYNDSATPHAQKLELATEAKREKYIRVMLLCLNAPKEGEFVLAAECAFSYLTRGTDAPNGMDLPAFYNASSANAQLCGEVFFEVFELWMQYRHYEANDHASAQLLVNDMEQMGEPDGCFSSFVPGLAYHYACHYLQENPDKRCAQSGNTDRYDQLQRDQVLEGALKLAGEYAGAEAMLREVMLRIRDNPCANAKTKRDARLALRALPQAERAHDAASTATAPASGQPVTAPTPLRAALKVRDVLGHTHWNTTNAVGGASTTAASANDARGPSQAGAPAAANDTGEDAVAGASGTSSHPSAFAQP